MGGLRHGTQEICRQFYFLFLLPILFLLGLARQVRNLLTQFPLLLFLCYFSKTDIGQKKGVSSLLSVCLMTKLTSLSRRSGRSYFRAYHIQCGPDGGSPFGTIHFLSSSHQKTCEKTWL